MLSYLVSQNMGASPFQISSLIKVMIKLLIGHLKLNDCNGILILIDISQVQ